MWKWIKIPKGIALLAFLLPWMTVSCQGTPIFKARGYQMVIGQMEPLGQQAAASGSGNLNILLLLAVLAIVAGIAINFVMDRKGAIITLGTSAAAAVLVWLGVTQSKSAFMTQATKQGNPGGPDLSAPGTIVFTLEIGFYLALAALVVAAIMSVLAMIANKDTPAAAAPETPAPASDGS